MKQYNKEIAAAFEEIADLLGIKGEGFFKIRAYREAATRIGEESRPITEKDTDPKELQKLERIGEAISLKMVEFIETGTMHYLEELRKEIPQSVRELLAIPGLGPLRVGKLYKTLGIDTREKLIKAAQNGTIEALPGFGKKMVGKILDAIDSDQQKKKRHERKEIDEVAEDLLPLLKKLKGAKHVEVAGSYRRGSPTVGDMDILVMGTVDPKAAEKIVTKHFKQMTLLGSGETKVSFVIFPNNLQVDIRFLPFESLGAALLYFTGNKDFNIKMRRIAIQKGWLLNEYGLHEKGEIIASRTEQEVFDKLEMEFVPPEERK